MSLWWIGPPAESLRLDDPSVVTEDQRVPRIIRAVVGSTFIEVACGGAHAMALTNDGRLFAWGWNDHGQCGLGHDLRPVVAPRAVVAGIGGGTVATIACGAAHSLALVQEKRGRPCVLYAWGAHAAGQLGHDKSAKVANFHAPCAIQEKTLQAATGKLAASPMLGVVGNDGERIAQPLSCGVAHSAMIGASGSLWTWGANQHGQCAKQKLGCGAVPDIVHALSQEGVQGVACGGAHTLALTRAGKVYAFGLNSTGQLGDGTYHDRPCTIPQPIKLSSRVVVTSVACGEEYSACITRDGNLFTWGYGGSGQLGHGNGGSMRMPRQVTCDTVEQVSCASGHVIARTARDGLFTWGYAGSLQQLQHHQEQQRVLLAQQKRQAAAVGAAAEDVPRPSTADELAAGQLETRPAEPTWYPKQVALSGPTYAGVLVCGQTVAPGFAKRVACGRFFGVIIGEPVDPMPENDAALFIQSNFRRDKAKKNVVEKRKRDHAAAVIGGRASEYIARRAVDSARTGVEMKERAQAAARIQAHQRRRMVQRQVTEMKLAQGPVIWTRGEWAPTPNLQPIHQVKPESFAVKPEPPSSRRVGGGFTRATRAVSSREGTSSSSRTR